VLVEILEDHALARSDAPGGGYAPIHAARVLRNLEAIEPMLRVLARCDAMDILYSALTEVLESFGPPVVERALAVRAAVESEDERSAIAKVLSRAGVRDHRSHAARISRNAPPLARRRASTGKRRRASAGSPPLDAGDRLHRPLARVHAVEHGEAADALRRAGQHDLSGGRAHVVSDHRCARDAERAHIAQAVRGSRKPTSRRATRRRSIEPARIQPPG
jgi:hypothetical protein